MLDIKICKFQSWVTRLAKILLVKLPKYADTQLLLADIIKGGSRLCQC